MPAKVAGSRTGVFLGLSNHGYGDFHEEGTIDAHTNLGLAQSIASNRVSYILDLKGPSFTVDTACSSGLVALHRANHSLQCGAEPLRVGSIKSNVGHLEPAAGIAGISKALLALKHRELPANLHFRTPKPKIDIMDRKLDVVSSHLLLSRRERPFPPRQNSCRLHRPTQGAAMKDELGSIRTDIQGQSGGAVAAARERSDRRGCARGWDRHGHPGALARGCAVQARPRAGLDRRRASS